MDFVHLHCHSSYSLLDGLGNPDAWVEAAVQKKFKALALTDHGSCSCAVAFFKAAKNAGIQPIVGVEFYVTDDPANRPKKGETSPPRYHLTVVAKTWAGLQSIFKGLSVANRQFYYRPLLSFPQTLNFEDCVVMSGCAIGILSHPQAAALASLYSRRYGDDFYLEIMPHHLQAQATVNAQAATLAKSRGIKLVASNDAHYPNDQDTLTHDVLLAVQTNQTLDSPKRFSFLDGENGLSGLYLKTGDEMFLSFRPWVQSGVFGIEQLAQAFASTFEIAKKCNGFEIPKLGFALPSSPSTIEAKKDEAMFLMELCLAGWAEKIAPLPGDKAPYADRLKHEIKVISKIGAIRYFLLVWDIVVWAKSNDILCGFGRGSVGGSLVAYLLGLTNLDPVQHKLYFERFLREDRIDMPDIDLDFSGRDRDKVIEYIKASYGDENVCQISTVSVMHGKSAFRDVSRVHSIPMETVNECSKRILNELSLEQNFLADAVLANFALKHPQVARHAARLDGQIRTKGIHAGGVVVSSDGFANRGVLESRKGGVAINWAMNECEQFGLLKIDILGLNTLTVLGDTRQLVKENKGVDLDFQTIQPNDPDVLRQFGEGHTLGVFQFESQGITALVKKLHPIMSFETLVHVNALYRPGPLDSGMVDTYVARYNKTEPVTYKHPLEKEVSAETLGLPIFQEQIMALFVYLAGFTWPEADSMRKIIAKSKGVDLLEEKRKDWLAGTAKNKIPVEIANRIYDDICKFGRYGFNKAHSACYSLIAYLTAWAKHHYPLEFMTALLRSVVDEPEQTAKYIREAKRLGIDVAGPDILRSDVTFTMQTGPIVVGFSSIKGIGGAAAQELARCSLKTLDFQGFLDATPRRVVNKRVVEALAFSGALDSIAPNSKWIVDFYPELIGPSSKGAKLPDPNTYPQFTEVEKAAYRAMWTPGIFDEDDVDLKAELDVHVDILEGLQRDIATCSACPLRDSADSPVPFKFSRNSQVLMVADFPRAAEDMKKEPLVGKVWTTITEMAKDYLGVTPGVFLKAQVYSCQPPGNKVPKEVSQAGLCGKKHLTRLIQAAAPKVIFAMGAIPYEFFTGKTSGILKANATSMFSPEHRAIVVFAISPHSLLYDTSGEKVEAFKDALLKLKPLLNKE